MSYKNNEGYPDPTAGKAVRAVGHMPTYIYNVSCMLGDGYNLEVNIQQKTVSVTLQLKHYKNRKIIWEMLEGIVPLDQIIDVIIIYNTYRAYKPFTYKKLKAKTYDQLRTEVIQ